METLRLTRNLKQPDLNHVKQPSTPFPGAASRLDDPIWSPKNIYNQLKS